MGKTEKALPTAEAIETTDELRAAYPDLVEKIAEQAAAEVVKKAGEMTAGEIKAKLPKVYATVAEAVTATSPTAKVEGFLLDVGDPYAAGVLRTFGKLTGRDDLRLPFTLPYKNDQSKWAVEDYILRANGAGDKQAVAAARAALAKCK